MKSYKIFALFLLCLSGGFYSCAGNPAASAVAVVSAEAEYRRISSAPELRLFPSQSQKSPCMRFEFTLLEVAGSRHERDFFNSLLYAGKTPARYRDGLVDEYRGRYLENRDFVKSSDVPHESFNWEYIERMDYSLWKDRGMVLAREMYEFTGGAHGMGTTRYYVIDRAEPRHLRLEDFFQDITNQRLRGMVLSSLRQYSNARGGSTLTAETPLSEGIFLTDEPDISGNFFISGEGLGLNWPPYEIAPYSAGSIEIILPWREIRPLLRHDAMELLEKFGIFMFM